MSQGLLSWAAFAFSVGAFMVYVAVLAMRPRLVRVLAGSGLFFTGLGLTQALTWVRHAAPGDAGFTAEVTIAALCLAVVMQSASLLLNRKAWDGVDRRATAGEGA
jgi:hypothetical protein